MKFTIVDKDLNIYADNIGLYSRAKLILDEVKKDLKERGYSPGDIRSLELDILEL